ncbi:MAG: nuclear transport factor 2 family protein [Magnetococcus sp. XQGC-1]
MRILVKEWADAWTRQDAQAFLGFYSENFLPEHNWNRVEWQEAYMTLLNPATRVRVTLGDLAIELETAEQATAFVRLEFASAGERWEKRKTLQLRKEQKQWRIVSEKTDSRAPSSPPAAGGSALPTAGTGRKK